MFTTAVGTSTENEADIPTEFALHPAYPNPFNPSTNIRFDLPESSMVRLTVFDALGRVVESLVDKRLPAGRHAAVWGAKDLSSGTYFIRLEAGSFQSTRTIALLR